MALKFYEDLALTIELTTLTTKHGNTGEAVEKKVFLANKDVLYRYEAIVLTPVDTVTPPDEKGWIQLAQDSGGSPGAYGAGGATMAYANITNNTGNPFWIKITNSPVPDPINKTDLQLRVDFNEFLK